MSSPQWAEAEPDVLLLPRIRLFIKARATWSHKEPKGKKNSTLEEVKYKWLMNFSAYTGCLVWASSRQAMVHTWIYEKSDGVSHPSLWHQGPLGNQRMSIIVRQEVDTVEYSWPEAMEAQAPACTCMLCANAEDKWVSTRGWMWQYCYVGADRKTPAGYCKLRLIEWGVWAQAVTSYGWNVHLQSV